MDAVSKRLEKLDEVIAGVTAEAIVAQEAWLGAKDPQERADRKEIWQRLVRKEEGLIAKSKALEAQLTGPGAASQAVVTQEQLQQAIQSVNAELIAAAKEAAVTTYADLDVQRSYKTATVIGKAILDSTLQAAGPFVRKWLGPLDTQLLRNLIDDAEAEQAWTQLQQRNLAAEMSRSVVAEKHVQEFYEKLLDRLHSLSNPHGVYVLCTSCGFGRENPDVCVSMSSVKAVIALVYAIEVKSLLSDTTKREEAASQCHERAGLIAANQQERSLCYAVAGGADAVELWRYSGTRADGCSNLLLLSWDAESPGLQALVRLWSMSPQDLGYVPARRP